MFLVLALLLFLQNFISTKDPISLQVVEREIVVQGIRTRVYGLIPSDGTHGITASKGEDFNVVLENTLNVPTGIHWHGILLPNGQDGVPGVTQYLIYPYTRQHYQFPLVQAGTFFMHSHTGLQEQRLLAAPLILRERADAHLADQEIVILLSDFSFKSPEQIYKALRCPKMGMGEMQMDKPDDVEVHYDAFLANYRTLDDPDIFTVQPGSRVRLRCINAASATNFFIDLGSFKGEAIAVDGNRIKPFTGQTFELGVAQRIDIVLQIPDEENFFPILAQGEGTSMLAGVLLKTLRADVKPVHMLTRDKAGSLTHKQEAELQALTPLAPHRVDQTVTVELGGDMQSYDWTLNGQTWPEITPIVVKEGQRVEMIFKNKTAMTHPMHLHGHVFQVTALNGTPISGALRDTVLIPPHAAVTIQFEANNPGVWPLHCHVLYHLEAGMMTVVRYEGFVQELN